MCIQGPAHGGTADSLRKDHSSAYINGETVNQQYAPYQPFSSGAATAGGGAASVEYEEENWDFVDPLYEAKESMDDRGRGTGNDKAELPYSKLWQMQLDREDQSHQEACEKYGKVRIVAGTSSKGGGEECHVCKCRLSFRRARVALVKGCQLATHVRLPSACSRAFL